MTQGFSHYPSVTVQALISKWPRGQVWVKSELVCEETELAIRDVCDLGQGG